jgi:hypothetical protein
MFCGVVVDIATCTVARAERVVGAIFGCHILASLLYGALNAESLHILIGRDFRLDMVPLNHQRQRHCDYEKCYGCDSHYNCNKPTLHIAVFSLL